ncbi:hypothetical protein [Corynebacterium sp. NML140438]|uniref:hypothetical protein n=1 Tax=Corynebacterium sp. NML140438 TaxID=1906334 RepID=UPI0015A5922B|nr:hypothetical protein [Corynebacterium sp. NML140438]
MDIVGNSIKIPGSLPVSRSSSDSCSLLPAQRPCWWPRKPWRRRRNQPVKAGCANLTDTEKDDSSTGGIIAGVVLGLLALIGIVVATNPGILNMF